VINRIPAAADFSREASHYDLSVAADRHFLQMKHNQTPRYGSRSSEVIEAIQGFADGRGGRSLCACANERYERELVVFVL
jgi:hypothetical protein